MGSSHTLWGWITIHRAYYHCAACHRGQASYDQDSGLGTEQLSPALAKACCTLAVDDSFAESVQKIGQLFGERMADTTVEALVQQVGAVSARQQEDQRQQFEATRQIPAAEAQPQRLYVSVDGTTARERDGWHEAKIGCIYWEDEQFRRHVYYVGRFCDSQMFGWYLWLAACRWGLRGAVEVIYLGDGAPWIRNEQERHFQRAVSILDWYHASEHLWDCGKTLFGEGTALTQPFLRRTHRQHHLEGGFPFGHLHSNSLTPEVLHFPSGTTRSSLVASAHHAVLSTSNSFGFVTPICYPDRMIPFNYFSTTTGTSSPEEQGGGKLLFARRQL